MLVIWLLHCLQSPKSLQIFAVTLMASTGRLFTLLMRWWAMFGDTDWESEVTVMYSCCLMVCTEIMTQISFYGRLLPNTKTEFVSLLQAWPFVSRTFQLLKRPSDGEIVRVVKATAWKVCQWVAAASRINSSSVRKIRNSSGSVTFLTFLLTPELHSF